MNGVSPAPIKNHARSLGYELAGIAPVGPSDEASYFSTWLASGYAGEMHYLQRQADARIHPETLLPGVRSVIVCAVNYNTDRPRTSVDRMRAWVSRYAWGADYHDTLKQKLRQL